ncbi:MAG: membrane integrity-associated transporter subunit PqiC [Victivallales bacterium]|nr:membrane integrity-associated transporter subunit PqiC [Victivallales bacterium]
MKRNAIFIFVFSALLIFLSAATTSCLPRGRESAVNLLASPLSWNPENTALTVRNVTIPSYVNQSTLVVLKKDGTLASVPGCRLAMPMNESLREALNCELSARQGELRNSAPRIISLSLPVFILSEDGTLNIRGMLQIPGEDAPRPLKVQSSIKEGTLNGERACRLHRLAVNALAAQIIQALNETGAQ